MAFKTGLSACIITLNEENAIEQCIQSLSFADEIILFDSYSKDKTCSIARSLGAKVFRHTFDNYVNQKNRCLKKAKYSWILSIDADEVLSKNLQHEIQTVVRSGDSKNGYKIPRMTFYLNRWIKRSGWYPDYSMRLVRNGYGYFKGDTVHEKLTVDGETGKLKYPMLHYSYNSISEHLDRINLYSSLIAKEKYKNGQHPSVLWAFCKSISKFFLTYFWKMGFLDGKAGFVIAVFGAFYNFQKYIKVWEMNLKNIQKNRNLHH